MLVKEVDRLVFLMEEISILKSRLQPEDTGHIHTTISTLENRVEEIRNNPKAILIEKPLCGITDDEKVKLDIFTKKLRTIMKMRKIKQKI